MPRRRIDRRRRRVPVVHYPIRLEEQYRRRLLERVATLHELAEQFLLPAYEMEFAELDRLRPRRSDDIPGRGDDPTDRSIGDIRVKYLERHPADEPLADEVGGLVDGYNRRGVQRQFEAVVGVQPVTFQAWLQNELSLFRLQNAKLTKSIPDQYLEEVGRLADQALQQGKTPHQFADLLRKRYSVTQNRARLIARDQVAKLNGQLTQLRHEEMGVTHYTWRTSKDERVRSLHRDREGKRFSWQKPPSDGHPGVPIQCRCTAEPDIEGMLGNEPSSPP